MIVSICDINGCNIYIDNNNNNSNIIMVHIYSLSSSELNSINTSSNGKLYIDDTIFQI